MDEMVYKKLKERASKNKTISYSDLVSECHLNLDLSKSKDRNALSEILGEIADFEVKQDKPMLSAVVVKKGQNYPSYGFFTYADELKVRKEGESDKELFERQLKACFEYWRSKI